MRYIKKYENLNGITFRNWVSKNNIDIDSVEIDCGSSNLTDLNGINNFINLKTLDCSNNELIELDLSSLTKLEYLFCRNNQLTELPDLSKLTNLKYISCYNNQLTELPDLSSLTKLETLYCHNNKLPYTNLTEYLEWHKKEYPWMWDRHLYNI